MNEMVHGPCAHLVPQIRPKFWQWHFLNWEKTFPQILGPGSASADYVVGHNALNTARAPPPIFRPPETNWPRIISRGVKSSHVRRTWLSDVRKSHLRSLFSKLSWGRPPDPRRELRAFGARNSGLRPQRAPPAFPTTLNPRLLYAYYTSRL
jgi:hypothetical protein